MSTVSEISATTAQSISTPPRQTWMETVLEIFVTHVRPIRQTPVEGREKYSRVASRAGLLWVLGSILASSPVFGHKSCEEQASFSTLEILSGSQITVAGAGVQPIQPQVIPLGRESGSDSFTMLNRMVFPQINLAFGQFFRPDHEGPTLGSWDSGADHLNIDFTMQVTDSDGVSVEFPFASAPFDTRYSMRSSPPLTAA